MILYGIDIGGTKTAVCRLERGGRFEEIDRFPTLPYGGTLPRVLAALKKAKASSSSRIGISCGGPLDSKKGLILSPPNLPGWDQIAVCEDIRREIGGSVSLMNDANACALAECWFGAGAGCRNLVFLTSGTGMGAGLILDGRLYEGTTGDAGEVGHLRLAPDGPIGFGKRGSFEGFCSGGGISRLAAERRQGRSELTLPEGASAQAIAQAAEAGDPFALEVLREAGTKLGEALALLVDILNPERIVIGGFYPKNCHLLEPHMRRALDREALGPSVRACQVVPALLGAHIGSYGALSAALYAAGLDYKDWVTPRA